MIRLRKVDVSIEKDILIGMIVSTDFLRNVMDIADSKLFDVRPIQLVVEWIREYYGLYGKAPGSVLEEIYKDKERMLEEEDSSWVRKLLVDLNDEYEKGKFNEAYLINRTKEYLRGQKLVKSAKKALDYVSIGKMDKAEEILYSAMKLDAAGGDLSFNPFDLDKVDELLGEIDRSGFSFGIEALDHLVGKLKWGWLFMIMGPPKRGKTWFLTEMAVRSTVLGFDTLFISLESSKGDSAERFYMNLGSLRSSLDTLGSDVDMPYFDEQDKIQVRKESKLSVNDRKMVRRKVKEFNKQKAGRLEVAPFPMYSAGLSEFKRLLDYLQAYKHFTPRVILVDYLGIMKAPRGAKGRDVYDENAKGLKGLAQEREALVCMGMQGSRRMMESVMGTMRGKDIPEDIRVLAHVDAGVGLNQTESEQLTGLMRLNVVAHRWRHFYPAGKQAHILQQYRVGQMSLDNLLLGTPLVDSGKMV